MSAYVTTSELAVVCPSFALLGSIRSRQESLKREWAYCSQSTKRDMAKPNFVRRCIQALAVLHQMEGRLDIPSPISHTLPHEGILACAAPGAPSPGSMRQRDATQATVEATVRKEFRVLGTATEQKQDIFGLEGKKRYSKPSWWLQDVMTELKSKGAMGRLAEHRWRMIEEIEHRCSSGWYVVFNTLTVDNTNYSEVFAKGSSAWRLYIAAIDRVVGQELYGNVRNSIAARKTNPFHSYFAVVERGGNTGRLHIHVIHCLRTIPESWKKDPNRVNGPPIRRQISPMKKFWRFGHSMPIACRFSDCDAFGALGWCWPVRREGDKVIPIASKPPIAIARYMCKYILKSFSKPDDDEGELRWRTRISGGFGLTRMRETIADLDRLTLWKFLSDHPRSMTVNDVPLPTRRLRLECLRSLLKPRRNELPESVQSSLLLQTIRRSLKEVSPRLPIAERLRSLMRPMTDCSLRSITTSDLQVTNDTVVSDVRDAFRSTFERPVPRFTSGGGSPRH